MFIIHRFWNVASNVMMSHDMDNEPQYKKYKHRNDTIVIKYLEFYSGIGGWSYALHDALHNIIRSRDDDNTDCNNFSNDIEDSIGYIGDVKVRLERIAAFDHSDAANVVLKYNDELNQDYLHINKNDAKAVSIERLTIKQLKSPNYKADIWAMSPPCQPYTRNNALQKDDSDPRSKSFLHLCNLLTQLDFNDRPKIIFLENVVGFEKSNGCRIFRKALAECGYMARHFHLDPTQVGLPNHRPRYFSIATTKSFNQGHAQVNNFQSPENALSSLETPTIETCLPLQKSYKVEDIPPICSFLDISDFHSKPCPILKDKTRIETLRIPAKVLNSNASWCFDVVTPKSKRTACFTHGYGQFVRGTGSVLLTGKVTIEQMKKLELVDPTEREFDSNWKEGLCLENLRYFSGTEIARLFGFPAKEGLKEESTYAGSKYEFKFPPTTTLKKQWQLLGNSLNVKVASNLCELGLSLLILNHI